MNIVAPAIDSDKVPLAVDVDGTLLCTDILHESALQFVARHPFETPRLLGYLAQGKAALKARLAERIDPGIESLPLRAEVVALIHGAQAEGRPVYLASASDRRHVERLAERIGGIAGVLASDGETNLAGAAKAELLEAKFGRNGFDYVGDTPVDLPVWALARRALVVAHSDSFAARVRKMVPGAEIVAQPRTPMRAYLEAMRPRQWAKNSLVFLALFAGHRFDIPTILMTFQAFFCFCAAASSAYIINDLLDLPGDRDHPQKVKRPFASGRIPILNGIMLSAALMALTIAMSLLLPPVFRLVLALYVVTTLAYSVVLKRIIMIDVIVLGGLHTLRVIGGLVVSTRQDAQWLLLFSLVLFLSLALVKRCSELVLLRDSGKDKTVGRGYRVVDLTVVQPMAAAAGYGAVLVFALYVSSPKVMPLYAHPKWLWLVCPLLFYWISRVLVISNRGEMHHDPVLFAITDKISWATAACVVAIVAVSI